MALNVLLPSVVVSSHLTGDGNRHLIRTLVRRAGRDHALRGHLCAHHRLGVALVLNARHKAANV